MKKILELLLFALFCFSTSAQIPNASFEDWTANEPDHWTSTNDIAAQSVTSVTPAYLGGKACKLETISVSGSPVYAMLSTTFADNSKPAALHGWYKFSPAGSDMATVTVVASKGTNAAGGGGFPFSSSAVFKEFVANIGYIAPDVDSIYIMFSTGGTIGDVLIIDNLFFGTGFFSSINELAGKELLLEGATQNPSSGVTDIIYDLPVASNVSLKIFDLNGKELKMLVNEKQSPGRFKAQFNSNELASGIYFCQLNAGGDIRTSKLMVAK